ncbi:MAG: putative CocE/NonD family hydrolase [Myxococcota bacterium]|jgi:putative CocE/NonD family hydrolase
MLLTALLLSLANAGPGHQRRALSLPPFESRSGKQHKITVEMPDGVGLDTRVHLPAGEGPWPVIFIRNPYPMGPILDRDCSLYVRYGFACVWQMVRGRGDSGGEWAPFIHERADGLAALDWILAQPWSSDSIGMTGPSYLGGVQWAMVGALPPEVKTIVPMVFGVDMYANTYEGGLFRHELVGTFVTLIPDSGFYMLGGSRYQDALRHRPRRELDEVATGEVVEWTAPWMDAQLKSDAYWQSEQVQMITTAPEVIDIPVLLIGGWSDAFLSSQLDTWQRLASRPESTLVIGPWDHLGRSAGDLALNNVDDETGLEDSYFQVARVIDWMSHHLKGTPARYPVGKALTYVTNDDRWAVRDAWPPPTEPLRFSLLAGDADHCAAPLSADAPAGPDETASYTYDPSDSTPSLGGAGSLAAVLPSFKGVPPGFVDQGRLCSEREDLLGWVTPPLEAPLHIAGSVTATLAVSSSAPDTAFNVRILDLQPDGTLVHVREGIRALSFRDGDSTRSPYVIGDTVSITVETWPVEYVFQPGSQVMVQVASASFPKFEAHSNTLVYWADAVEVVSAEQTIHLSASSVELPVVTDLR